MPHGKLGDRGGKKRQVLITNQAQRALLEQAKAVSGSGSLIPVEKSYKQLLDMANLEG